MVYSPPPMAHKNADTTGSLSRCQALGVVCFGANIGTLYSLSAIVARFWLRRKFILHLSIFRFSYCLFRSLCRLNGIIIRPAGTGSDARKGVQIFVPSE